MAHPVVIRVIAPPLGRAHLVDLLVGYESSGFFHFDPRAAAANEAAIASTPPQFRDGDVFAHGPLKGRRILDFSPRMQTLALAPRHVLLPDGRFLDDATSRLVGTAVVVSVLLRDALLASGRHPEQDAAALDAFLSEHHGLTAVIGVE